MILQTVYERLKKQSLCSNAYDFSVNYLSKSPSYYSVVTAKNTEPSIETLTMLQHTLSSNAQKLDGINYQSATRKREILLLLAEQTSNHIAHYCNTQFIQNNIRYRQHSIKAIF